MNQLYPIIRRARRPLLPMEEPQPTHNMQPTQPPNGATASNGTDVEKETKADAPNTPEQNA